MTVASHVQSAPPPDVVPDPMDRRDDRFVPLRAADLIEVLADEFEASGGNAMEFRAVASAVREIIDQESACFERELDERYAPCNPDLDTVMPRHVAARSETHYAELNRWFGYLLEKANFAELDDVQIEQVVHIAESRGLRVRLNPQRIASLSIWVRGRGTIARRVLTWRKPFRGALQTVPVFRRLVILARLRDDHSVIVKMFKDIPEDDIEALLPHAEVTMSWRDHMFTLGGSMGALGSAAWKFLTAAAIAITQFVWVLTFGLLMMAYRVFMGYRRARAERDSQRTRHLYYQNLTNNSGTLHLLVQMIAQEELKEAMLAYVFCLANGGPPADASELSRRVEQFLKERFAFDVRFDTDDAIATLERLRLWNDRDSLKVLPTLLAIDRLREHWQHRRSERQHCVLAHQFVGDGEIRRA